MGLDLAGKVVVVTGAAGGIGSGIASACAERGAEVVLVDRVAAELGGVPEDVRGRMAALTADLSTQEGCDVLVKELTEKYARLDGLVNCAGVMRRGDVTEIGEDDWRFTFDVNLDAVFRLCKAFVPMMGASGGGSIVNIASQWGVHPAAGHVAYNTSKSAVVAFSRSLARDHGHVGVRVNAVCPGEILTPMVEEKLASGGMSEAELAADIPIGRLGRPEDVAELVVFLLGDGSTFVSGATVEIAGGQVAP